MNTRRNFIQQGSLALTGLVAIPSAMSAAFEHRREQKVGLGLFTLRNELTKDVKDTISKVAKAGYNMVETYYGYGGNAASGGFWSLDAKEFKSLISGNNLTSPSGHYRLNDFLTKSNGSNAEFKQMEVAVAVGQEFFVIPALPQPIRDNGTADDYKFIAAQFNKVGEECKKHKLKLAYHNHAFEFKKLSGDTTGYDILLKETDPALVNFEVDLFWAVKAGVDPITLFKQSAGRFAMWHVKDMDKNNPDKFTEVGTGSINYRDIFSKAKAAGLKHLFIEQDEIYLNDKFESINKSYKYTRSLLREI